MELPDIQLHSKLLLMLERESTVARIEALYRKPETEAAYARACELRDHYDAEFKRVCEAIRAGLPARLTNALQQAQSQSAYRAFNLLLQLNHVRALVARDCNNALGEASPYWNDKSMGFRENEASYEALCDLQNWEPPEYVERESRKQEPEAVRKANEPQATHRVAEEARASARQQTPTQPATHQRNDLTRRTSTSSVEPSEGCEEREERKQSMQAPWRNAERMHDIMRRVDEWFAKQKPQPEGWGDCEAVQPAEDTSTPEATEPTPEFDVPAQSPAPEPVAATSEGATCLDSFHQLTPLQQAALAAIGNWLLVIGHCGSTKLTTGGSTKLTTDGSTKLTTGGSTKLTTGDIKSMAQARRPRPVQAVPRDAVRREVRRYSTPRSKAGPGGACFRTAA